MMHFHKVFEKAPSPGYGVAMLHDIGLAVVDMSTEQEGCGARLNQPCGGGFSSSLSFPVSPAKAATPHTLSHTATRLILTPVEAQLRHS